MPDPDYEPRPQPRAWLQVPGYPAIEMRQEHDMDHNATVTEARTMRNGELITARALVSDELMANVTDAAPVVNEHQTQTVARLMHHVNELDLRLAQHQDALGFADPGTTLAGPTQLVAPATFPARLTGPTTLWMRESPVPASWVNSYKMQINEWVPAAQTYSINTQKLRRAVGEWQTAWNFANNTTTYGGWANNIQTEYHWDQMYYRYTGTATPAPHVWIPQRQLTVAERAVMQIQAAVATAPTKAMKQLADAMSEALLAELLGIEQFRYWRKNGVIYVTSKKFKRKIRYEIAHGQMIRLHEHTGKGWRRRRDKLCIHPLHAHPRGDELAALYALASFDEDTLWKVANHHFADEETPLPLAA